MMVSSITTPYPTYTTSLKVGAKKSEFVLLNSRTGEISASTKFQTPKDPAKLVAETTQSYQTLRDFLPDGSQTPHLAMAMACSVNPNVGVLSADHISPRYKGRPLVAEIQEALLELGVAPPVALMNDAVAWAGGQPNVDELKKQGKWILNVILGHGFGVAEIDPITGKIKPSEYGHNTLAVGATNPGLKTNSGVLGGLGIARLFEWRVNIFGGDNNSVLKEALQNTAEEGLSKAQILKREKENLKVLKNAFKGSFGENGTKLAIDTHDQWLNAFAEACAGLINKENPMLPASHPPHFIFGGEVASYWFNQGRNEMERVSGIMQKKVQSHVLPITVELVPHDEHTILRGAVKVAKQGLHLVG